MRIDFSERRSRRVVVVLALVAALAVIMGTLRWTIPTGWSEARLRQSLVRTTGYRVESFGQARFSALPWPTIHVSGLLLSKTGESAERIEAGHVKARLNTFSWLIGDPRLVELTLFDPKIDLAPDTDAATPSAEDAAILAAIVDLLGRDRRRELRALRLERGTLRLGGQPWLSNLALKLTGGVGADLRLTAIGEHNGRPLQVQAEVAPVGAGERRPVRATITAQSVKASFAGVLFGPRSLDAEGQLEMAIVDGSAIARRLGLSAAHAPLLNAVTASGRARFAWPAIQVRDARIERGQTRLDGSIEASFAGARMAVAATLDAPRLDASPLFSPLAGAIGGEPGRWSDERLAVGWLQAGSVDLRLSAGQLQAGPLAIDNAAVSLQLGGGRMDLMLSDGRVRGGSLKGRLSVAEQPDSRLDVRLQGSGERLDLGPVASAAGLQRLRGSLNAQLSLRSTGVSVAALMAGAEGRAEVAIRDGELPGFDLDRMAARSDAAGSADRRTRFTTLTLHMQASEGRMRIAEGAIVTPANRTAIEGTIGLAGRTIDLTLRPAPTTLAARPGEPFKVRLEGPWSSPSIGP